LEPEQIGSNIQIRKHSIVPAYFPSNLNKLFPTTSNQYSPYFPLQHQKIVPINNKPNCFQPHCFGT